MRKSRRFAVVFAIGFNVSPTFLTSFRPLAVTFGISYRLIKHKERRTDILFEGFVHCYPQRPR